MLEFPGERISLTEYKNGSDDVVDVKGFDELEARMTRVITSLLDKSDFQDVVFMMGNDRAIRILFELDPDYQKVTLYVEDQTKVPYVAYFVDHDFNIHFLDIQEYLCYFEAFFNQVRLAS